MSQLLTLDETKLGEQVIPMLEAFEVDIALAESLFKLEGERLESIARVLPHNQSFYDQRQAEAKQLVKWLENHRNKIEARLVKNHLNSNQRAFGAKETSIIINGEKEMVEHNQLIIEASLIHQKLEAIVEAFGQMGWMLGHITKLRAAEMHNAIL